MSDGWEDTAKLVGSKYREVRDEATAKVREIIRADLDQFFHGHSDPGSSRYAERACRFATQLFGPGAFQLANEMFDLILREIAGHPSGATRHLGLPLYRQAESQILLNDYDEAVPRLIAVANSVGPEESQDALQVNFVERTCELATKWAAAFLNPKVGPITIGELQDALEPLGEGNWGFLGAISLLQKNARVYQQCPTEYGRARLLDSLRTISASVEGLVTAIGRDSAVSTAAATFQSETRVTLGWGLKNLFENTAWWSNFSNLQALTQFDATSPESDFDTKIGKILAGPTDSADAATSTSLALATLVRNYTAHSIAIPASIAGKSKLIAGGLSAALVFVLKAAHSGGHGPT